MTPVVRIEEGLVDLRLRSLTIAPPLPAGVNRSAGLSSMRTALTGGRPEQQVAQAAATDRAPGARASDPDPGGPA